MTDRNERIVVYVTESTKEAVKHEATTADKSMAEWTRNQIHRGLKNSQQNRLLHETNAEQRINQLISQMDDRLADRLQEYQDLIAANANYAAANHILFQRFEGIGSKMAADARSDASEILQDYPGQQPPQSTARASESRAQDDSGGQQQPADSTADSDDDGDLFDGVD